MTKDRECRLCRSHYTSTKSKGTTGSTFSWARPTTAKMALASPPISVRRRSGLSCPAVYMPQTIPRPTHMDSISTNSCRRLRKRVCISAKKGETAGVWTSESVENVTSATRGMVGGRTSCLPLLLWLLFLSLLLLLLFVVVIVVVDAVATP